MRIANISSAATQLKNPQRPRSTHSQIAQNDVTKLHQARPSLIGTISKTMLGLVELGCFLSNPSGFIDGMIDSQK